MIAAGRIHRTEHPLDVDAELLEAEPRGLAGPELPHVVHAGIEVVVAARERVQVAAELLGGLERDDLVTSLREADARREPARAGADDDCFTHGC